MFEGAPQALPDSPVELAARRPLAGRTVLLVEDDDRLRPALARLLLSTGAAVVSTSSGGLALEVPCANVDLVFTDYDLGDMWATDLIPLLRTRQGVGGVPLLVYTGSPLGEVGPRLIAHGADVVLAKPTDPEVLLREVIRLVLRGSE